MLGYASNPIWKYRKKKTSATAGNRTLISETASAYSVGLSSLNNAKE
jgi:hypothetical protein